MRAPVLVGPDLALGVSLASLPEGVPLLGHAHGVPVVLVRRGEEVSALGAVCTHWHGPMADALVVGDTIRCPWHHACFRLADGGVVGAPALDPLPSFLVVRAGDRVSVGAARPAGAPLLVVGAPASVVIVGAGGAGAVCAETLRREGYTGDITLVGDEWPVDRPNLSKDYLAGTAEAAWLPLRTPAFYDAHDIAITAGDPVTALDPAAHRVSFRSGRTLGYGALVLATGAAPRLLTIPGADLPHVYTLRTLADADAILACAGRRAAVIGAGFIGLEVAASLRSRGLEVSVVAPEEVPLLTVLGAELGGRVRALHEAHGVDFFLGAQPAAIDADGVELTDGRGIPADLVVIGVGVRPRTALAEAAGLMVDDGVVVDECLRSSDPDIYAAGDVARLRAAGAPVRVEHWVVAMRHGRAIARTLVGRGAPYRAVPYFWSQHYDVPISMVGYAARWDRVEVIGQLAANDATVAYHEGGRIAAVATLGRDRVSLEVEAAMERGDDAAVRRIVRERR